MSPLKHILVLLPFFLISHFVYLSNSQFDGLPGICNADDKKTLLRIKKHLGNPPSLASWDIANECCVAWGPWDPNVRCNDDGRVISLSFSWNEDIYKIPPFLDQLPALVELAFIVTPVTGPIPRYIGKLTNLTSLTFNNADLSGPIPNFLGRLINLVTLDLYCNNFSGPIPNFLGELKRLTFLSLSFNKLTGPIPKSLGHLTRLEALALDKNNLSGPIPDFLGRRLRNLQTLHLYNNQLTGPVPRSLAGGRIAILWLNDNKLTGDASFLIDKRNKRVVHVDLSYNQFKFDFTNVELAPRLFTFNLSHNNIYGRLPKLFYRLKEYFDNYIDITYNQLCGPIPNGRHLKRVDPIFFAHNKCLCGGPLRACK